MKQADAAFVMIDVQNDFCPGGALAVDSGDTIVPQINRLQSRFDVNVLTQDWHPDNHSSFADTHEKAEPFSVVQVDYGDQVLWPKHCVMGSDGAAFHPLLRTDTADLVIRKGFRPNIDSYSAFFENDKKTRTGLAGYLRERDVTAVYLSGLATDFCVYYSAMDAAQFEFDVYLITDCCRAIDLDGSLNSAMENMQARGVKFITSDELLG